MNLKAIGMLAVSTHFMTPDSQFLAGLLVGDTGSLDCRVGRKVTPHHSLRTLVCGHKTRAANSSKEGVKASLGL